mmetsp:Transcript_412/g.1493  ORF Transcript_412/g.1493 Transcript_412/m.1493 type:complete len:429 (-) Transcript_412:270-1556(-)
MWSLLSSSLSPKMPHVKFVPPVHSFIRIRIRSFLPRTANVPRYLRIQHSFEDAVPEEPELGRDAEAADVLGEAWIGDGSLQDRAVRWSGVDGEAEVVVAGGSDPEEFDGLAPVVAPSVDEVDALWLFLVDLDEGGADVRADVGEEADGAASEGAARFVAWGEPVPGRRKASDRTPIDDASRDVGQIELPRRRRPPVGGIQRRRERGIVVVVAVLRRVFFPRPPPPTRRQTLVVVVTFKKLQKLFLDDVGDEGGALRCVVAVVPEDAVPCVGGHGREDVAEVDDGGAVARGDLPVYLRNGPMIDLRGGGAVVGVDPGPRPRQPLRGEVVAEEHFHEEHGLVSERPYEALQRELDVRVTLQHRVAVVHAHLDHHGLRLGRPVPRRERQQRRPRVPAEGLDRRALIRKIRPVEPRPPPFALLRDRPPDVGD